MDINQQGLSKSQKRKQKKRNKRHQKTELRKSLQAEEQRKAIEAGRLIEENHNGGPYSPEFTREAEKYYITSLVHQYCEAIKLDKAGEYFLKFFREIRVHLQTLALKWSDGYERTESFFFIVGLLDVYRDNKTDGYKLLRFISDVMDKKIIPYKFQKEYNTCWDKIVKKEEA